MRTLPLLIRMLLATGTAAAAASSVAEEFVFGSRKIRVPDGYEVQQITNPSLVERPIAVARDERGRLYVTDSGGMTERAEQQLEARPHNIRRLEDSNNDGIYDRSTLFADRMMFPEGCQWFQGSLYVAAPPEIWKLTDTNDDGVADQREVWFDGRTLTGCGNDLHGPYLGLDGMMYWCKGAFAEQSWTLPGGKPFVTHSSHIFRARTDGTQMEPVLTGGMDNPVNVAFLANGERFLSCTFFQHPEAGRRDGLIHAIYGGVYGKKHDSIYAHQMTGDVMPVLNHQGAAAPCGLIAGSESLFGGGHEGNLFACYFNLHRVIRHELIPDGPTYTTRDVDFVSCDHPDFHPTDVFEDADGSLLVVDTGGWYKVCCPTSQLAKPDVLGAVYRIRRRDASPVADPLGNKLDWNQPIPDELAGRLADQRLFVRRRATQELRNLGTDAVDSLRSVVLSGPNSAQRCQAVWTLAGIHDQSAAAAARPALHDKNATVRQAAAHVSGLFRDREALEQLLTLVDTDEPGVARAAAEAVGRIGDETAIPHLLAATVGLPDSAADSSGAPADASIRIREHALIYALIEIDQPAAILSGLNAASPKIRRAALVALDQIDRSLLDASHVISLMNDPNPTLRATAAWIVSRRAEWGSELAEFFRQRLASLSANDPELDNESIPQLIQMLSHLARSADIQQLLLEQLQRPTSAPARSVTLQAMTHAGLPATPPLWLDAMADLLMSADPPVAAMAVAACRQWTMPNAGHPPLVAGLLHVAADTSMNANVRMDALTAAGSGLKLNKPLFNLLLCSLDPEQPMGQRTAAAGVLGSAALTSKQRSKLLAAVPWIGPLELPKLLPVFEQDHDESFGLQLVSALQNSDGLRGLRTDLVRPLLSKYPASVQEAGKPLLTALNASAEQQAAHLDNLLLTLPAGDIHRGHEVFMGKKAACISCHKLGYGGGRLGPDLSTIGRVRNRRDLLEATIYPSESIVRGYEPVIVELLDGRTVPGIVISESRDDVVIGIDAEKTTRVLRAEIAQILPSSQSPMPNGLATLLTAQELADLMAFLQNLK